MELRELKLIFKTLAGSQVYGTDTPESDTDTRGVVIPPKKAILGLQRFEQMDKFGDQDQVLYALDKACKLCLDCNPNMLELLFTPNKYWLYCSPTWQRVLEIRNVFVSKKAKFTYSGYAHSQFQKINRHRQWAELEKAGTPPQKPHRKNYGLDPSQSLLNEEQLKAATTLPTGVIVPEFQPLIAQERKYREDKNRWDEYNQWKQTRNPKRFALELKMGMDSKNALHLVRLMRMGREILMTGQVNVDRRGIDAHELIQIREGAWSYEQLSEWFTRQDAELDVLYESSTTRHKPDHKQVNDLLVDIYEQILIRGISI